MNMFVFRRRSSDRAREGESRKSETIFATRSEREGYQTEDQEHMIDHLMNKKNKQRTSGFSSIAKAVVFENETRRFWIKLPEHKKFSLTDIQFSSSLQLSRVRGYLLLVQ